MNNELDAIGKAAEKFIGWKDYIKDYPKLAEYWNNIPEPLNILFTQQIDFFAKKYAAQFKAEQSAGFWVDVKEDQPKFEAELQIANHPPTKTNNMSTENKDLPNIENTFCLTVGEIFNLISNFALQYEKTPAQKRDIANDISEFLIDNLPAKAEQKQSTWIDVKDRLRDYDGDYLTDVEIEKLAEDMYPTVSCYQNKLKNIAFIKGYKAALNNKKVKKP